MHFLVNRWESERDNSTAHSFQPNERGAREHVVFSIAKRVSKQAPDRDRGLIEPGQVLHEMCPGSNGSLPPLGKVSTPLERPPPRITQRCSTQLWCSCNTSHMKYWGTTIWWMIAT